MVSLAVSADVNFTGVLDDVFDVIFADDFCTNITVTVVVFANVIFVVLFLAGAISTVVFDEVTDRTCFDIDEKSLYHGRRGF